jgi:pyruvate dehydrogenase E2 component (dihydrolipoamide acetyltransferase)
MPPLGQTTEELKILKWLKSEGDRVELGEALLQVETDKADLEVESYFAGVLLRQLAKEGEVVSVGDLVAYLGEAGEETPAVRPAEDDRISPQVPATESQVEVNRQPLPAVPGKVLASPRARQLAKLHDVDLSSVQGSGPSGRIELEDVARALNESNT